MPSFRYRACDPNGQVLEGIAQASDARDLTRLLAQQNLTILDVSTPLHESSDASRQGGSSDAALAISPGASSSGWRAFGQQSITAEDVMLFSRQMGALQKAGIPILSSLSGLQEAAAKPAMSRLLVDVRLSLEAGRDLASALARHPRQFSEFYRAMIGVGELTGRLSEAFLTLHDYQSFERDTRAQIRAALRYPAFVVVAMSAAMVLVNVFVIPVFARVFESFNAPLPWPTQFLIAVSALFVHHGWAMLLAIGAAVVLLSRFLATPAGRMWWGRRKLMLPLAGPIVRKVTLSRFSHSLGMSLRSGVPIAQALDVVGLTLDNAYLQRSVGQVRQGVERGDSLTQSIRQSGLFPPLALQMVHVGEQSGELDAMLAEISALYARDSQYDIRGLSAALEPVLLVLVSLMVLVLALGIFLPLWSLGGAALGR